MTSLVNQGITGSQIQNRDESGAQSRAPILQQHSGDAAGGDAADQVSATSHGGRGGGRGGSGWGRYHPAGTSSVRFPGSAQGGALEMVTEQDIPGRHATPGWHRETRARYGDKNVPTTRSTHRGGDDGGWDSDGGSDVSASGAASDAVPLQPETVHLGMEQSARQSSGPDVHLQVEDNSIPMDLDSDDESAGPSVILDACPQGGSESMAAPALHATLTTGDKQKPQHGPRTRSKNDRAKRERWAQPHLRVRDVSYPEQGGPAPSLVLNLDTLGQSDVSMPGDDVGHG